MTTKEKKEKESLHADAYKFIGHFGKLFKKTTGKEFSPSRLDWHAARLLVRPGGYGMAAAMTFCDLWFSPHAPWAERAKSCGYALLGSAKPQGGMEWHLEWMTDFPTYDERKRKYSGE